MANILIFGGSGIISTEIVNLAVDRGNYVTIVNRGIHEQHFPPKVKCIISDLRNDPVDKIKEKLSDKYDTVIDFISYTTDELKRNMELAKDRCSQYIFVSTATVYNKKQNRYAETDEYGDSDWSYSINKSFCEHELISQANNNGYDYTIIRPYITYNKTRIPLQFAPLEYYTIINRMICGKCIPVYNNKVCCTLTSSKDFAVAAVGLIQNKKAYGTTVHITGQYETTWNEALIMEAKAFNQSCEIILVPLNIFKNKKITEGLNVDEVIGDKSCDMLFDNSLIHELVPEFSGNQTLEDILPEIVAYFNESSLKRKINYAWDARVDYMLIKSGLLTKQQKKKLHFASSEKATVKDFITYILHRYEILYKLTQVLKK